MGEVKKIATAIEENEPTPAEAKELILSLADSKHKKCYGRGYTGWNLTGNPVICECVRKNLVKRRNETK